VKTILPSLGDISTQSAGGLSVWRGVVEALAQELISIVGY